MNIKKEAKIDLEEKGFVVKELENSFSRALNISFFSVLSEYSVV